MPWIVPAVMAAAAVAQTAASAAGQARNNAQQNKQYSLEQQQLADAQQNQAYQRAVQAMVNQRAVAGTQDSFGTSITYDPQTNTWVQSLGAVPKAADTAAINANLIRNTTDLMQQELANRASSERAALAGGAADTAQRNLANFRPMGADELTGLLSQQGINAARQVFDPLRADTLRALARASTAAGPVVSQLGLGEAKNLRDTLIDARIKGMTGVDAINNANYGRLSNAATTTNALATPTLGQGNLGTSATDQLLQQLTATRAQWAPSSTAQGAYGANMATGYGNQATSAAAARVPNSNFGLDQTISGLKDFANFAGGKGDNSLTGLVSALRNAFGNTSPDNPTDMGAVGATNTNWGNDAINYINPNSGGIY